MQANTDNIKDIIFSVNTDKINRELLTHAVETGRYTDTDGLVWNVVSDHADELIKLLESDKKINQFRSDAKGEYKGPKQNYKCQVFCFDFIWLRKREFNNATLACTLDGLDVTFKYHHDLQTRVTSCCGMPQDLSKYTVDKTGAPKSKCC